MGAEWVHRTGGHGQRTLLLGYLLDCQWTAALRHEDDSARSHRKHHIARGSIRFHAEWRPSILSKPIATPDAHTDSVKLLQSDLRLQLH